MSASLYQSELSNIISESKRKNHELRTAAEKSLQELKSITVTSEQQLAADLSSRPSFVEPFLRACSTRTNKLAISGVNGLQRLVISQGLPKDRLDQALQAFNACTELGLDIQLKVLQALPSLVQNYSEELRDDLLSSALQVCASLQGAKVSTISAVAAATLQQLVTAVFASLAQEDIHAAEIETVAEVPGETGPISLRPAAYDAYRVFQDLVLVADGRAAKFVQLSTLSREDCLELIESSIEAKPRLIAHHAELAGIIRSNVIPLVMTAVSEQLAFPVTVRSIRIIRLLCTRHFPQFAGDLDAVLALFPHALEPETPSWKRVMLMEILRDIFSESGLIVMAYMVFDQEEKHIVQDIMATMVRLSSEKPAVIGLGQHSTIPSGPARDRSDSNGDHRTGVTSVLSSLGVVDTSTQGVSSQWSIPKTACYEQLDKAEAPALPETYIYSLILECLHGLSESLAKVVLPLTVHHDEGSDDGTSTSIPVNPLSLEETPAVLRARAVASLIENCWPAWLATCSTFLNAALDDSYYRSLIKSYQRFAQVAGLLRLSTPRDALMTTLGKSAVPPQVINAITSPTEPLRSPGVESPRSFSNSMGLLSIENLVNQASSSLSLDRETRSSMDAARPVLTVRNLLCLRALLNLAIALGPTLGTAFAVVVDVLKQADMVLSSPGAQQFTRPNSSQSDPPAFVQSFSAEVSAVETAASRLLESTADYPDQAFLVVLNAFSGMLRARSTTAPLSPQLESRSTASSPVPRQRTFSGLSEVHTVAETQSRNYQFVLPKLTTLASLNISRFITSSAKESGWQSLTTDVLVVAVSNASPANARKTATDMLCKLSAECVSAVSQAPEDIRRPIQLRCFGLLFSIVRGIYEEDGQLTNTDLDVQGHVISALRAILDRSGDTIVAGWDNLLALLSSTYESQAGLSISDGETGVHIQWASISNEFISPRIGRDAFGTVQLICAEFFSLMPLDAAPSIIELLFRFMGQVEDLNLALTAITVAWNVSDLLFDDRESAEELVAGTKLELAAVEAVLLPRLTVSRTAQWLFVLAKLRRIVDTQQIEPAKAAFQTICSICKVNSEHISPAVWTFVMRNVLIGVLEDQSTSDSDAVDELAPIVLSGTAEVFKQQVELFDHSADINSLWASYLDVSQRLLERSQSMVTGAVWQGLAQVLMHVETMSEKWHEPILLTAALWSQQIPSTAKSESSTADNQPVFRAYTALAAQLLRLLNTNIDSKLTENLIINLRVCVRTSTASYYGADVAAPTNLQREVLEVLQNIPLQLEGISAKLIDAGVEFAELHSKIRTSDERPSFVALSVASIEWLQVLSTRAYNHGMTNDAPSFAVAYGCLARLTEEKYDFQVESKSVWLWRRATSALAALSGTVVTLLGDIQVRDEHKVIVLDHCVRALRNVLLAKGLTKFDNVVRTYQDETEDIAALTDLCKVLVPCLSSDVCPPKLRSDFAKAAFEASIIHAREKCESISDDEHPLADLNKIRRGRVKTISPCRRERMSYQAFSLLVKLALSSADHDSDHALAEVAVPWLLLRLAVPIRAYIADQPLRSRMPQPLSEHEELLFVFTQIEQLNTQSPSMKVHCQCLYPLLIRGIRVAGDKWCGAEEVLMALQQVLESF